MPTYSVFGRNLRSDLPFPELACIEFEHPDWTLTLAPGEGAPSPVDGQQLGEDVVEDGVTVRLHASDDAYWLHYDDTGWFRVSRDGTDVRWLTPDARLHEEARADVLGRVLALAMHAGGKLCLHGSAVTIAGEAIAFLAPKFHGKSTTAMALAAAGARLLTDDTLVVDTSRERVMALPGVPIVRLWQDAAALLAPRAGGDDKICISDLPPERQASTEAPLAAVYLLNPDAPSHRSEVATRERLAAVPAALALVGQGKLGALFGRRHAADVLQRAATVAETTPVYRLSVVRDLDRLAELVDQMLAWHGASAPVSVSRR